MDRDLRHRCEPIRRETGLPELAIGPAFDLGDALEQAEIEAVEGEVPELVQDPEGQGEEFEAA